MPKLFQIIIGVLAIGASAQLVIHLNDFYPVPITAQSMVVLIAAHLLRWKWAAICMLLYLAAGIIGAPIFAGFTAGWETFSGKSMGFLIGFVIAALVVGRLAEKQEERFLKVIFQFFIGSLIILICGYLNLLRFFEPKAAFIKGVFPFLPGMLIKIIVGAALLSVYRRFKNFMQMK